MAFIKWVSHTNVCLSVHTACDVSIAICSYNMCFLNHQPETQETMSYSTLTKDYPRYPSVFECTLTEQEKDMLMVWYGMAMVWYGMVWLVWRKTCSWYGFVK